MKMWRKRVGLKNQVSSFLVNSINPHTCGTNQIARFSVINNKFCGGLAFFNSLLFCAFLMIHFIIIEKSSGFINVCVLGIVSYNFKNI